jgi:hypothetical protein
MKLLGEAAAAAMIRLGDLESEARGLVSQLDSLDIHLHRAFTAVCIDSYVAYLNAERNRMLNDEKRAETNASLATLPAMGAYGLFSLFTGQEPNWKGAVSSIFREQPYGDIRVGARSNEMKLINVSGIARERGISVTEVVAYLEQTDYKVFSWPEFETRAEDLRMAALRGETTHLGIEEAALEYLRTLTTGHGPVGIPSGHSLS